jgi:hypothetical protein
MAAKDAPPDHERIWLSPRPPAGVFNATEYVRADLVAAKDTEIDRLRRGIDRMLTGGNHLATHIDPNGPQWKRSSWEDGLNYYGPGPAYDAWCCWKSIMLAREIINGDPTDTTESDGR